MDEPIHPVSETRMDVWRTCSTCYDCKHSANVARVTFEVSIKRVNAFGPGHRLDAMLFRCKRGPLVVYNNLVVVRWRKPPDDSCRYFFMPVVRVCIQVTPQDKYTGNRFPLTRRGANAFTFVWCIWRGLEHSCNILYANHRRARSLPSRVGVDFEYEKQLHSVGNKKKKEKKYWKVFRCYSTR